MEKIEIYELEKVYDKIVARRACGLRSVLNHLETLQYDMGEHEERVIIEKIDTRLKCYRSAFEKCVKKRNETPSKEAFEKMHDIAGVRVIVPFLDDVYRVRDALVRRENFRVIEERDYIKNPKKSGYRSLHIIAETKIALEKDDDWALVEIQIRTVLQDSWSTLEHTIRYKNQQELTQEAITMLVDFSKELYAKEEQMMVVRNFNKMKTVVKNENESSMMQDSESLEMLAEQIKGNKTSS